MLRFRVIASKIQLVKIHFISHPSLHRHKSPEKIVICARRATPQDSSQVFHKTACVAPSSSVLDNTSPVKLAVCQGRRLAKWRHSDCRCARLVLRSETNISGSYLLCPQPYLTTCQVRLGWGRDQKLGWCMVCAEIKCLHDYPLSAIV